MELEVGRIKLQILRVSGQLTRRSGRLFAGWRAKAALMLQVQNNPLNIPD